MIDTQVRFVAMRARNLMTECAKGRVASLDYVRSLACICVVVGHTCLIGCIDSKTVAIWVPYIKNQPYYIDGEHTNPYASALIYASIRTGLNVGHLGVATFFLISGFVILRSLDRETVVTFAVRRLFRILPCCAVAVAVTFSIVAAACSANSVSSPLTFGDSLASATITMNILHRLPTVPVLWSLEVEIVFYFLMATLAATGRIGTRRLLIAALASSNLVFVLLGLSRAPELPSELSIQLAHLSQILIYIPLMLVGAVTYRCWDGGWRSGSASRVIATVAIFFAAYLSYGPVAGWDGLGVDTVAVIFALALFAAAVTWRRERRWLAPLRFVSAVSYPLYLVHAPFGWIVLAAMSRHGFSVHTGCAVAILASLLLAWGIHVLVERPGQRIGAALSTRLSQRLSIRLPFGTSAAPSPTATVAA